MRKDCERLFSFWHAPAVPAGLLEKIFIAIGKESARALKVKIVLLSGLSLAAAAAFIPAWRELQSELSRSGFFEFVSLLISDSSVALAYWKEFSLSLLESLPALGVAAVLGTLFALFLSLQSLLLDLGALAPSQFSPAAPHRTP